MNKIECNLISHTRSIAERFCSGLCTAHDSNRRTIPHCEQLNNRNHLQFVRLPYVAL